MPPVMPVTLALDTATPYLTLALLWEGGELESSREVGRAHAELLAGAVQDIFAEAGLPFRADQIIIGTGPGSYTGVRVGASYALGLGRVWSAPVLGVCTLEGLVVGSGPQAVSLDARKGNVYSAVYEAENGVVSRVIEGPAKREGAEFAGAYAHWPQHHDTPPSGLGLLRAGLAHGAREWELAYL